MIRCRNLAVRYPGAPPTLSDVTLAIRPGEMAGLLGPNGSGKTTLLRAVAGSVPLERGEVLIQGRDAGALPHKKRARRMAFVPQRPEIVPELVVFDMVLMGRYAHRKFLEPYTEEDKSVARQSLEETGLARFADRPAKTLSGGELQRAYIARAFAQQSPLLLLDEPATGLDPAHAAAVFDSVRRRNRETGATVLAAIHDLNLAALYCDRLIFLQRGVVLADGPTRDVFTAENLERLYGARFLVLEHPAARLPQAMLVPEGAHA